MKRRNPAQIKLMINLKKLKPFQIILPGRLILSLGLKLNLLVNLKRLIGAALPPPVWRLW